MQRLRGQRQKSCSGVVSKGEPHVGRNSSLLFISVSLRAHPAQLLLVADKNGGLGEQRELGREPNQAVKVELGVTEWVNESTWMNSEDECQTP